MMQSKPGDPLQALVVKLKEQYGNPNQFIQSIRLVPDPSIVLFNESQLNDTENFCASSEYQQATSCGMATRLQDIQKISRTTRSP